MSDTPPKDGTVFLARWDGVPVFAAWVYQDPETTIRHEGPFWRRRKVEMVRDESGFRVVSWSPRSGDWALHGNFAPFTPDQWMLIPERFSNDRHHT